MLKLKTKWISAARQLPRQSFISCALFEVLRGHKRATVKNVEMSPFLHVEYVLFSLAFFAVLSTTTLTFCLYMFYVRYYKRFGQLSVGQASVEM